MPCGDGARVINIIFTLYFHRKITNLNFVFRKSQHEIPLIEVTSSESPSEAVPQETLQKMPVVPYKSLIKSFGLRTKKVIGPKTIGPSPSTGKRGAQILELSRKIQNEPPNKKIKKGESPQKEIIEVVNCAVLGELVVTPEGSPARTAPWIPRIYSPYASPTTSILKKRALLEEPEDGAEHSFSPASSASKARRVSFADPEVSHSVKISPVKKWSTRTRTRRSLINTYENSQSDQKINLEADRSVLDSNENKIQISQVSSAFDFQKLKANLIQMYNFVRNLKVINVPSPMLLSFGPKQLLVHQLSMMSNKKPAECQGISPKNLTTLIS